jgi:hypothetical protein
MNIPLDSALVGIQRGQQTIQAASSKIASPEQAGNSQEQSVEALVELEKGKQQVQASSQALSAENTVIGSLLSVKV